MAFKNTIPQPDDKLSQSQGDLLDNFQAIDNWVKQDHIGLTGGVDQGKHTTARFVDQQSFPTINSPETGFFNAQPNNLTSLAIQKQEMYVKAEKAAGFTPTPFTASSLSTTLKQNISEGWCYLPSGLIMKWGSFQMASAGNVIHNFPTGTDIPIFNQVYSLQLTLRPGLDRTWAVVVSSLSTTSFQAFAYNASNSDPVQTRIDYLAIGA